MRFRPFLFVFLILIAFVQGQNPLQAFETPPTGDAASGAQPPFTIANPSYDRTQRWVPVPVPYERALTLPAVCSFVSGSNRWIAVRGPRVGYQTWFYDVHVDLPSGAFVRGDFDATNPPPTPTFNLSGWISDSLGRIVPRITMREGGRTHLSEPKLLQLDLQTPARQSWSLITRVGPMVVHYFATIWSGQDTIEWQLFATFSDPTIPAVQLSLQQFLVEFGEPVLVEDVVPLGIRPPYYDSASDNWSFELVNGAPVNVGDAQGLPALRGALLCTDNSRPWWANLLSTDPATRTRVAQLLSRGGGAPVSGAKWENAWLAFRSTVYPIPARDPGDINHAFGLETEVMTSRHDLYEERRRGLFPAAGSTGDQGDFGASQGGELTLGDLRGLAFTWFYHTGEPIRPMHYREADGSIVLKSNHPSWWTWSQVTHYSGSVSPDRLMKPYPGPDFDTHGWTGKDDQHMASNAMAACIAAADWPVHRLMMDDEIRTAEANVRFLQNAPGAARAVGRRMQTNANQWLCTGRENVWTGLVIRHAKIVYQNSFTPFANFRLIDGPYTDPRVMVDPATGEPVPAIYMFQETLGMNGLVAGWAAHLYRQHLGLPESPDTHFLRDQIVEMGTTLSHYWAQGPDGWQTWLGVRWLNDPNNQFPTDMTLQRGDDITGTIETRVTVQSAWFPWCASWVYYVARAQHGLPFAPAVLVKLQSIADEWDAEVAPNATLELRHWMAVVQR